MGIKTKTLEALYGRLQRYVRIICSLKKCDLVCSIDWNFIGKMETLNQDTEWVIEDMGVKGLAEYPKRNKTTKLVKELSRSPII